MNTEPWSGNLDEFPMLRPAGSCRCGGNQGKGEVGRYSMVTAVPLAATISMESPTVS